MNHGRRISFGITGAVILISSLFLGGKPVFAAGEKYAYVDVAKIFDGYQKTKDQDRILQDTGKKKEGERDKLVNAIRQMKDELALLTDDAKVKKQDAMDGKVKELQDFDLEAKRQLGEQRNQVVREIFKNIDDVVQRYGERKGYDMVFNERALLYHNARYDVTPDVLKELNDDYAKKKK